MVASTLLVTLRHGIWHMTLDGTFFADYRSKGRAREGAEEARKAMVAKGQTATIMFAPDRPAD